MKPTTVFFLYCFYCLQPYFATSSPTFFKTYELCESSLYTFFSFRVESLQKQTMGVTFNLQNSKLLTVSLPTEGIFSVTRPNWPVANRPVVCFRTQPREMPLPKPLEKVTFVFFLFFWVFYFLPLLENFSLCKRYKLRFNSHSPKKFRQMTLNWKWWRLCHSFINKREWRKRGMMC